MPASCVGRAVVVGIVGSAVRVLDASAVCVTAATETLEVDEMDGELLRELVMHADMDALTLAESVPDVELDGDTDGDRDVVDVAQPVALREGDGDDDAQLEALGEPDDEPQEEIEVDGDGLVETTVVTDAEPEAVWLNVRLPLAEKHDEAEYDVVPVEETDGDADRVALVDEDLEADTDAVGAAESELEPE